MPLRVLGIDPGTVRTGWGVIEKDGSRLVGIAAGVLVARESMALEERLKLIFDGLTEIIRVHAPAQVAVEDIFFAKFPQAALKLGHARGVALVAAANAGLSVDAYPPAVVKQSVSGRGRSEKAQVAQMVCAILGWRELPAIDASDALAVAITHANASGLRKAILAEQKARKGAR